MSRIVEALRRHAHSQPDAIALQGRDSSLDYRETVIAMDRLAALLASSGANTVGLLMDNSPAWAVTDLALLAAEINQVPLPPFFSDRQLAHAIEDAAIDCILTDQPERIKALLQQAGASDCHLILPGLRASLFRLPPRSKKAGAGSSAKITYTSGTTGQPKGVALEQDAIDQVALSLAEASAARPSDRHLVTLPLSTLLENIGGLYVPLLAGARSVLMPLAEVGMGGSSQFEIAQWLKSCHASQASSAILVPQLLFALVQALQAGAPLPALRFIAVGGAPVSQALLQQAMALGLPVFQGYGLSECASVVAVNTPADNRPGSVGRPLPHVRLRFAPDGEILLDGALFQGYLGSGPRPADADGFFPSGDLGHLDDDGYLWLTGRKKNIFITAFGRNVAPEWVESELTGHLAIAQAAVFGEGQPWNIAVIVPRPVPGKDLLPAVAEAIAAANAGLPDYGQVKKWLLADEPFTPANGQLTANGRLRREAILATHNQRIDCLYESQ